MNILSPAPKNHTADCMGPNTKAFGDVFSQGRCSEPADFADISSAEPRGLSVFASTVNGVVGSGTCKEMRRVDAAPGVAMVTCFKPSLESISERVLPRVLQDYPMSIRLLSVPANSSIAIPCRKWPQDTLVGFGWKVAKKALQPRLGSIFGSHRLSTCKMYTNRDALNRGLITG